VRTNRVTAAIVSIVMVVAVLEPLRRKPWDDSFPLSPYAMFAFKRPTKLTMDYAYGVTPSGEKRTLTPRIVGSAEVLQALTIFRSARAKNELPQLCTTIAERVAAIPRYADVTMIKIVSGTHDAVDYLVRGIEGTEVVRMSCAVRR